MVLGSGQGYGTTIVVDHRNQLEIKQINVLSETERYTLG